MRFIALIFAMTIGFGLKAQPLSSVPYEMNIETAEEQMALNDFYNARTYFINAYEQKRSADLALKIAQLNEMLRDYKKASTWYNRVMKKDKQDAYLNSRYDYANVLKQMGRYGEAVEQYNYFMDRSQNDLMIEKAMLQIQGIKEEATMEEDIAVTVENAGRKLNGKFEEASPSLDPDGSMLYSTINTEEVIILDGKNENIYSQIYSAEYDEKKGWQKGKELSKEINREGYHTANASISSDGNSMFFTRSLLGGNKVVESKAYVSFKAASGWGPAQELSGVNGDYIVKHPVSGELYGNQVLFFASDMDGGKGGFDIYYSTKKGETAYSLPTNLGSTINTNGDDVTPYYNNGVLYFSSDGHPTIGGFDVFSSTWDGASWSDVANMGKSYNSTYDDLYFTMNKEGNSGFMVSNRPGTTTKSLGGKTCCADIWKVEKRALVIDLFARGVDEEGNTVEDITGEIYDLTDRNKGVVTKKSSAETNKAHFLMDADKAYKVVIKKEGYFPAEKEFNTVGKMENYTYKKKFLLKKMPVDPTIEIVTINEAIRLGNIYYDFDDDKILSSAEGDLNVLKSLMDQYPDMVIELGSHTDSQGGDAYNQSLSERRAKSAKRWLVQKGIDEDRVEAVGYGEEEILNECENGVKCSDDEHRFNRRTEFKITAGPTTIEIKKEVFK